MFPSITQTMTINPRMPCPPNCGYGTFAVTEVQNVFIPLSDGVKVGLKFWLPTEEKNLGLFEDMLQKVDQDLFLQLFTGECREEKTGMILEAIPYCKDDDTHARDRHNGAYFASHGFIFVRMDLRGSGASEGVYHDEYTTEEWDDCRQIIEWMAGRKISNGRVGMYGKSWGGFNSLQVAYTQPPALKAIVSMYSTDCRYSTDIYYCNGSPLAVGGLPYWCSVMHALNARPPTPNYFATRADWEHAWAERVRLGGLEPWTANKLSHDTNDEHWQHGSIGKDYSKLHNVATLLIGGWNDGYADAALRMSANLNEVTTRTIIGPWTHSMPDSGTPGPNIDHREVMTNWWRKHLLEEEQVDDIPAMSMFVREIDNDVPCSRDVKCYKKGSWLEIPKFREDYLAWSKNPYSSEVHPNSTKLILSSSSPPTPITFGPSLPSDDTLGAWCAFDSTQLPMAQPSPIGHAFPLPHASMIMSGGIRLMLVVDGHMDAHERDRRGLGVRLMCNEEMISFACPTFNNINEAHHSEGKKTLHITMRPNALRLREHDGLVLVINTHLFPMTYPALDESPVTIYPALSHIDMFTLPSNTPSTTFPPAVGVFPDTRTRCPALPLIEGTEVDTSNVDHDTYMTENAIRLHREYTPAWSAPNAVHVDIEARVKVTPNIEEWEVEDALTITLDGKEWHKYDYSKTVPR